MAASSRPRGGLSDNGCQRKTFSGIRTRRDVIYLNGRHSKGETHTKNGRAAGSRTFQITNAMSSNGEYSKEYLEKNHYVYVLRCADGTLYTGWTTDLERRVKAHNSGKGAKYTRSRKPVELVYFEVFDDKIEAQKREYAVKRLSRAEKEVLISRR